MSLYVAGNRMLEYASLKPFPEVFGFSTTRHGGYSAGQYASFNCNGYCGDDAEATERNIGLLRTLLPKRLNELIIPHQVHGKTIRRIDENFLAFSRQEKTTSIEGVDALITNLIGACLCISTADCIPVLCYDMRRRAVAAVHAGWRGTVAGIVTEVLQAMHRAYGTEGRDVQACIGPGISVDAFEVGDEVYERFRAAGFCMDRIAVRREKWHIDLWEANRMQLLDAGVQPGNIEVAGICTWANNDDFFSARRQGIASGRILSGIMLV